MTATACRANGATAWLVHGFNVRDGGAGTVDMLAPHLTAAGWVVSQYDYGWTLLLGVLFGNPGRGRELARDSEPGDVAIGHSNGCAIIHRALHSGAHFRRAVYINPALDVTAAPPAGGPLERVDVFYAPDDMAVLAAKVIPGVLWGAMGREGYQGPDSRIRNHNLHNVLGPPLGHSGALHRVSSFGPFLSYILGPPR